MIHRLAPLLVLACTAGPLWACPQDGGAPDAQGQRRAFEFQLSPASELYFEIRGLAALPAGEGAEIPAEMVAAVAEVRALQELLASPKSWPVVDGAFTAVSLPGEFAAAMSTKVLPPRNHLAPDVKRIRVGNAALRVALVLDELAPKWMEEQWPARQAMLSKRLETLRRLLPLSSHHDLLRSLEDRLGIRGRDWVVPVKLVTHAPGLLSATFLERDGGMTCFLSTAEVSDAVLAESALYEIMYARDAQPFYPASMSTTMRKKLRQADISDELQFAVNAKMMHLFAADLMRRFVDPAHKDAGEVTGDYARRPKLHALEEPLWRQFSTGEILRPEFVDTLCLVLGGDWDEKSP